MASHWTPDDDFLLRKSIENGASLESLAKGAIKVSRKFTLSELTNRWHSLLYDPNVTSITSSIGFDLQYSTQLFAKNDHHITQVVRSQYYETARKKMRVEEPPNYNNQSGDHNSNIADPPHAEVFGANLDFLDELVEFDESQFEILRYTFPEIMQEDQVHDHSNGQIHDDTTQEFQDPHHFQEETYQECDNAMLLSELDPHPEIKDGIIICILNKESDEIPDNSDFNPHLHNPRARNSINPSITLVSSLRKHLKPPLPPTRIPSTSVQAKGNENGFGDSVVAKQESLKDSFRAEKATSNGVATTSTPSLQHSPKIEICQQIPSVEIDMKDPSSSEEEENNNEMESYEDLPSFSDVEAMVLDMDLEPVGQDQFLLEVSRYQNEEAVRMIMRLEQSFESYMNRDIASHGAFALLYGSAKHYINKEEVLLGRATEDYPVDIDLGRSEKLSRRQALITLKQDGSFEIKNLGKLPIWMNDKEIKQGEVVELKNHSLIQIREMSLVFESNEKAVRRYLDGNHV